MFYGREWTWRTVAAGRRLVEDSRTSTSRTLDRLGGRAEAEAMVVVGGFTLAVHHVTYGHLLRHGRVGRRRVAAVDERRPTACHRYNDK